MIPVERTIQNWSKLLDAVSVVEPDAHNRLVFKSGNRVYLDIAADKDKQQQIQAIIANYVDVPELDVAEPDYTKPINLDAYKQTDQLVYQLAKWVHQLQQDIAELRQSNSK